MTCDTINDVVTMRGGAEGALLAGRYRVVRQLGSGGMGSVWLAEDTQLDNKPFAVKMLPSILVSNKRAYRQLKDEALVAMQLVYSNIVQIRAFEENNGNPFLVMDYIEGQTLDDYLADMGNGERGAGNGRAGAPRTPQDDPVWRDDPIAPLAAGIMAGLAKKPEERPKNCAAVLEGRAAWWGGTVGYKFETGVWVASDGSSSGFSFKGPNKFSKLLGKKDNIPTSGKDLSDLRNDGWITQTGALAPEHDAAHVHWGGNWRMPSEQELSDLNNNCDWIWTQKNGVNGYEVRGRSDYASNSIFFPCAGYVNWPSIRYAGSYGCYWSSVPGSGDYNAWGFDLTSSDRSTDYDYRNNGQSVRPVQGFAE